MYKRLLGVLLLAGLLSFTLLQPVRAQTGWCITIPFTEGDEAGWAPWVRTTGGGGMSGATWTGGGWESVHTGGAFPFNDDNIASITQSFTETVVTEVTVTWTGGHLPYPFVSRVIYVRPDNSDEEEFSSGTGTLTRTHTIGETVKEIRISIEQSGNQFGHPPPLEIISVKISGEGDDNPFGENDPECEGEEPSGDRMRPLADEDEHAQWDMFDRAYVESIDPLFNGDSLIDHAVFAFANKANAKVSAVAAGTVIDVRPFSAENDCSRVPGLGSLYYCLLLIPRVITQELDPFMFTIETPNVSRVIIRDEDDPTLEYTYYVKNTTLQTGDKVVMGCIIGETIQLKNLNNTEIKSINASVGASIDGSGPGLSGSIGVDVEFRTLLVDASYTIIIARQEGSTVSLFPTLVIPPTQTACREQVLSGCANEDPDLTRLDNYDYDPGVTLLTGGGVTLAVDDRIYQRDIVIDPEVVYTLNVQARLVSLGGDDEMSRLRLSIGLEGETFDVTGGWQTFSFTPEGDEWYTPPNLTSISVGNGGGLIRALSSDIEIRYICLAPASANTAPGSCYFANNEFDLDGTSWIVNATSFASGQAYMVDGSYISQMVNLFPADDGPHTYTIRAVARLLATSAYTGQVGKEVSLQYEYPGGGTPVELGAIDSAAVISSGLNPVTGAVQLEYPYTLTGTLEISTEINDDFLFRVEVTDVDGYIMGLRLDSVCVDPEGDGSFPNQPGDGGYEPPFIVGCSVVPIPIEGSIAAWTYYHWSQLNRFFKCELMKLLNNWFKMFDGFRRTMLGIARWWIALVHHLSDWAGRLFMWMDGHFRNIATGQVTTITESGGCHDFFCAIVDVVTTLTNFMSPMVAALNSVVNVLLGVLVGTVNLFFTIIGGLVAFVVALLVKLFSFFQLAAALLATIVGAYNTATPTVIPGLPTCATDPNSSPLCVMVWVTDNTIFSGRWGILWAVFLSIAAVHLIIWAIHEFKDVLIKTWGSS